MELGFHLEMACSACGQSHSERAPETAMPRVPGGEVSADFCLALALCPACNRVLHPGVDRKRLRAELVSMGWTLADPVATRCPPASVCPPLDWI